MVGEWWCVVASWFGSFAGSSCGVVQVVQWFRVLGLVGLRTMVDTFYGWAFSIAWRIMMVRKGLVG